MVMHRWFVLAVGMALVGCSKLPMCQVPVIYDFDQAQKPTAEQIAVCLDPRSMKIPKARQETVPRLASPWQTCEGPLAGRSPAAIYQCADQAFWQGFSDGRRSEREKADRRLSEALSLLRDWQDHEKLARAHFLRGALRLAMSLENGKLQYAMFNGVYVKPDMVRSQQLHPEGIAGPAFLKALDLANQAMFKRWERATPMAEASIADAYHVGIGAAFALGGTLIGFPLDTGIPASTVSMMETVPCDVYFCDDNTAKAPFAVPGLAFHQAEGYARVGDRDGMLRWIDAAQRAPGYDQWFFKPVVEGVAADPEAFLAKFRQYGTSGSPFMEVYANSNFGCVFCHGRM